MKSVMNHQFSMIPRTNISRSVFKRSHGHKTTFDSGWLIPFYVDEALPGDTFKLKTHIFARLSTQLKPIMDNVFLETFYFAVPNRILWDNWKKFMGEQNSPDDSVDYLLPQVYSASGGFDAETIYDYMGIPIGSQVTGFSRVSALPLRAYSLIWKEWFKDQNLQDLTPGDIPMGDGPDSYTDYELKRRCKYHDYFTSCLPSPQKGEGIDIPIGGTAPVFGNGFPMDLTDGTNQAGLKSDPINSNLNFDHSVLGHGVGYVGSSTGGLTANRALGLVDKAAFIRDSVPFGLTGLYADLDEATSTGMSINLLREAFQLQKMLERDMRGGTRYTEIIRSHFGVISPDARMQRPEYLGGSSQRMIINPVQQTSESSSNSPQGNLSAFGLVSDSSGGFSKSFTEHCTIIGLVNVRADITYQYGLHRMWTRRTREEFYWPELAHLGEQAVLKSEIFHTGHVSDVPEVPGPDVEVFGYQERYAEYRYKPSIITGQFRSSHPQTLDVWHLSQEWANCPTLDETFIVDNPPIDRILAVPGTELNPQPQIIMDAYLELICARPMPVYSVPGFIDHF